MKIYTKQGKTLLVDGPASVKFKSPKLIHPRNREKRKLLRDLCYKKYMKAAKMQSLSFRWVKVRSFLGSGGSLHRNRLNILCSMLGGRLE